MLSRYGSLALSTLITALAVGAPPWVPAARNADGLSRNGQTIAPREVPKRLRLALLPDRTTGRDWGLPHLARAVEDLRRLQPDAIFTIGDMVQGYTRSTDRWDAEWNAYEKIVESLGQPLFPVAGNHDVVAGSRDPYDRTFEDRYRARVGPLWYEVRFDLLSVIVLFTDQGPERIGAEQLAWLAQALPAARERGRPVLLLLHRPVWISDPQRWASTVATLLAEHPVDAVVAGHFHALHADRAADGTPYHVLGVAGGMIDQHPLAGHIQHLTFLDVDDRGVSRFWHQPIGSTLGDDFVARADRERANRLANEAGVVDIVGALPEPWPAGAEGSLVLTVRNPIDRPIEVTFELVRDGAIVPVEGEAWTSSTLLDAHNPFVIDASTPYRMRETPTLRVEPGDIVTTSLRFVAEAVPLPAAPPEVRITLTFEDQRGRGVPVWRRLAPPIARRIPLGDDPGSAVPFPLVPWIRSPYDVLEPNPTAAFWLDLEGRLVIDCLIDDAERPDDETPPQSGPARWSDPFHDAIRLHLGATGRTFFVEPFRHQGEGRADQTDGEGWRRVPVMEVVADALCPTEDVAADWREDEAGRDGQRALVRLRIDPRLGPFDDLPIQVGFADNDATYHTQWRWLAPTSSAARLRRLDGDASSRPAIGAQP